MVFISHASAQGAWARRFQKILINEGLNTFLNDIALGQNLIDGISDGLENSRWLVVLISPESLASPWVRFEQSLMSFLQIEDQVNRRHNSADSRTIEIIPVIIETVDKRAIPAYIRSRILADLTNPRDNQNEFKALLKRLGISSNRVPNIPTNEPESLVESNRSAEQPPTFRVKPLAAKAQRRIAIIGMGYIGISLAGALAAAGHQVVGVEPNESKFDRLSRGTSHLLEPGIDELLHKVHAAKKLTTQRSFGEDLATTTEIAVICLGPSKGKENETWDTTQFISVISEIGLALRTRKSPIPLNIIIAATIRPDDYARAIKALKESVPKSYGTRYVLAMSPLFLREGSMLADIQAPPFIVIGTSDGQPNSASDAWGRTLHDLASASSPQVYPMTVGEASMVKLVSNTYHAMKVCFANEVGRICHTNDIDAQKVMDIFSRDKVLNISELYLRPGSAFGGSCLGKDIQGLLSIADRQKDSYQLIESLQPSNKNHLQQAATLIKNQASALGHKRIGFLGLTFKPGTDDVRSSPAIELIRLLPRGLRIHAFDPDLNDTPLLTGRNLAQWLEIKKTEDIKTVVIPSEIISSCRILVITKSNVIQLEQLRDLVNEEYCIIDLTGETKAVKGFECLRCYVV